MREELPTNDEKFYKKIKIMTAHQLRKKLEHEHKNYCMFCTFCEKFSTQHYVFEKEKTRNRILAIEKLLGIG